MEGKETEMEMEGRMSSNRLISLWEEAQFQHLLSLLRDGAHFQILLLLWERAHFQIILKTQRNRRMLIWFSLEREYLNCI